MLFLRKFGTEEVFFNIVPVYTLSLFNIFLNKQNRYNNMYIYTELFKKAGLAVFWPILIMNYQTSWLPV